MLTIAIPTYNRNQILLENLRLLLPQLCEKCKLLVIDNSSEIPVSDTLNELLASFPEVDATIVRNSTNIGLCGNFLRCFELCDTEWMWLLGDDDEMVSNGVQIVIQTIQSNPECIFMNFSSDIQERQKSFFSYGLDDFVRKIDSFSNLLFISCGVYKVSNFQKKIKIGYTYSHTAAPHIAVLLSVLKDELSCYFSRQKLIHWKPSIHGQTWTNTCLYNLIYLVEIVKKKNNQHKLAYKIIQSMPPLEMLVLQILQGVIFYRQYSSNTIYFYDKVFHTMIYFSSWKQKIILNLKYSIYRKLFLFPIPSYKFLQIIYKITKKKQLSSIIEDIPIIIEELDSSAIEVKANYGNN
jgi:abequosyltransferase